MKAIIVVNVFCFVFFLLSNSMCCDYQFQVCPGHSTMGTLLLVSQQWSEAPNRKQEVRAVSLDLSLGIQHSLTSYTACKTRCLRHPAELSALVGSEREALLTRGVMLGGARFSVIRDSMNTDQKTIDLRGRPGPEHPSVSLAVGRASSALVLVMGKEGVHGGNLNKKVAEMAEHLCKSGL
uniref:Profilin n=1 Tax=Eptatretus burgeri TaxID=7764 RepID=A0A8C4QAV5_EPTBU